MTKAVLWDNDGVLMDTEMLFFEANEIVLKKRNILLDRDLYTEVYSVKGENIIEYYGNKNSWNESFTIEAISERQDIFKNKVSECEAYNIPIFNGIHRLSSKGIRNIIVTGSSKEELKLKYQRRPELLKVIDDIVTSDDYDNPKPKPDAFWAALKRNGICAQNALAIDDLERGIISARAACINSIKFSPFDSRLSLSTQASELFKEIERFFQ